MSTPGQKNRRPRHVRVRRNHHQSRVFAERLEARKLLAVAVDAGASQAVEMFDTSAAVFVENAGQWSDPSVRFVHQGRGASIAMTDAGPVFEMYRDVTPAAERGD